MKTFCFLLAAVAPGLLFPSNGKACSCIRQIPCQAFADASAVFIGRMTGGSEKVKTGVADDQRSIEAGAVRFTVEETFKGALGREETIQVSSNLGTSCGPYGLVHGEKYVVYAYGEPSKLSTGVCTRTSPVAEAEEDIEFLRHLPEPGTGGALSGRLWADEGDRPIPLSGVTVVVHGNGEDTRVVTDSEGDFHINKLKPGKYTVHPVWPEHYFSERAEQDVTISDRGCTTLGFEAKPDIRLAGRLFDHNRRPASIPLHLLPVDAGTTRRPLFGFSHPDGTFEIKGIPPGNYLLFIELLSDDWKNRTRYFFPGTANQEEANVIKLGAGQSLSGYDFQIPDEYSVQTLEGRVVWPDGTPAQHVRVMLLCPKSTRSDGYILEFGPPETQTDEQGRFKLQGFRGTSYALEARGFKGEPSAEPTGYVHSPTRPLILKEDLADIKLVLSDDGLSGGCDPAPKRK